VAIAPELQNTRLHQFHGLTSLTGLTTEPLKTNLTEATAASKRRQLMLAVAATPFSQWACSQSTPSTQSKLMQATPVSDEELKHRFRSIRGGERVIDGLVVMHGVALYNEKGWIIETGSFSPKGRSTSGYSGEDFVVPKTIRMVYHGTSEVIQRSRQAERFEMMFKAAPLADVTVEVATRIPIEVLDAVRSGGGLRVKTRVTPWGPLIGWDVVRRPRYSTDATVNKDGPPNNFPLNKDGPPDDYWLVGGDFREAHIFNGKVVRKGWYIDKKTGQKVETEF
jgi:hypothetical protein